MLEPARAPDEALPASRAALRIQCAMRKMKSCAALAALRKREDEAVEAIMSSKMPTENNSFS